MKFKERPFLLVLVGFAVGIPLGWWLGDNRAGSTSVADQRNSSPSVENEAQDHPGCNGCENAIQPALGAPSDDAYNSTETRSFEPADLETTEALLSRAEADSVLRHALFDQLLREADQDTRGSLLSIIAALKSSDIQGRILDLLASGVPENQASALDMMQYWATNSSQAQQLIEQTLHTEASTDVLTKAMRLLNTTLLADYQVNALQGRMQVLAEHPAAEVRAGALARLSQDHPVSAQRESYLLKGISDSADLVKLSALYALSQQQLRSESLRQSLLVLVESATASFEVRRAAIDALAGFQLNGADNRRIEQIQADLDQTYFH